MEDSKKQSPIDEFDIHGIKTVGDYDYWLLLDATGRCVIARIKSDDTTFLFNKMPDVSGNYAAKEAAINAYWVDPTAYTYKYLFMI